MGLKVGIWSAIAVTVFGSLLAAVSSVLKSAHVHWAWAAWPIALAGVVAAVQAGPIKPMTKALTEHWTARAINWYERRDRARDIEQEAGGLPLAGKITDSGLLGIHRSIPLPLGADASLDADLPLYIARDLDVALRGWVATHRESGGFLLLVGPTASGKSRCAYELVHDTLADWPMFMPTTAAQLTEYFAADPAPGRLVIWLDEAQKFLGPEGLTAATVRRIHSRPAPVIIVGTIWPFYYDTLTGTTVTATGDGGQDAREILVKFPQRMDLGSEFSTAELDRAARLAARDPRIAEATGTASLRLAETLAAARELISRWLTPASQYGAAVITAAVIARRCGHPEPLPAAVLEPLAADVLSPAERSQAQADWFTQGLEWARVPLRGTAAPLTPYGSSPGVTDGDQVSDVLVQHATRNPSVPGHIIPEARWLLLIEHASAGVCGDIGYTAYSQRHAQQAFIAEQAFRKAADAGDVGAMSNLGILLAEQDRKDEAEQWYRTAANAGFAGAMSNLGVLLREQDRKDEAEQWYRTAANAGFAGAMYNLGVLLRDRGKEGEAEQWYRTAADIGHADAMHNLAVLLREQGRKDEAERWYRKAAGTDSAA